MTPAEIIQEARRAGLTLRPADGGIGVKPKDRLTPELAETIRANRAALLATLNDSLSTSDSDDIHEHLEERAAIMEHDGGLPRPDAERQARQNVRVFTYRLADDPAAELVFIAPGASLDDARRRLAYQFGADRVIEVRDRRSRD